MNPVNLSKCRVKSGEYDADECLRRDGRWVKFDGMTPSAFFPYQAGGQCYFRDGTFIMGAYCAEDILAVRRGGDLIMGFVPERVKA